MTKKMKAPLQAESQNKQLVTTFVRSSVITDNDQS